MHVLVLVSLVGSQKAKLRVAWGQEDAADPMKIN